MHSISIHALREEGDPVVRAGDAATVPISIHALREEGDAGAGLLLSTCKQLFLSTPSARRATQNGVNFAVVIKFLSTPSARRATIVKRDALEDQPISIHALREEGDPGLGDQWFQDHQISIHALREEGDTGEVTIKTSEMKFLSTPSARRATSSCG